MLIPLLEAAVDESREELQALWAALLANAMVDGGRRVRRDYFEAVRQMEPLDAVVLDIVSRRPNAGVDPSADVAMTQVTAQGWQTDTQFILEERRQRSISDDDFAIAKEKLARLSCISNWPEPQRTPALTAFGRGLLMACKPPT